MDPIKFVLDWYFSLPVGILPQIMLVCMILCLSRTNFMNALQRDREKKIARVSLDLVNRIESLLPVYEDTIRDYGVWVDKKIGQNPGLIALAQQIPDSFKTKSERDFCLKDADRLEAITLLQMQTIRLVNQ